jgi:hypothetical protein
LWGPLQIIRPACTITFSRDPPSLPKIARGLAGFLRGPPLSLASTQIIDRDYYQIVTETAPLPVFAFQLGSKNTSIKVSKTGDEKKFSIEAVLPRIFPFTDVLLELNNYFLKTGALMECPGFQGWDATGFN